MTSKEMANKFLRAMKDFGYTDSMSFIGTPELCNLVGIDRAQNHVIVHSILQRLRDNGVVDRSQSGKTYYWWIKVSSWDENRPFRNQDESIPIPVPQREQREQDGEADKLRQMIQEKDDKLQEYRAMLSSATDMIEQQTASIITLKKESEANVKTLLLELPEGEIRKIHGRPHPRLERVLKLANGAEIDEERVRMNILLIGPAGSGKSYLAEQVAKALNLDFAFITCSAGMSEGHLLGRLVPSEATPKEVVQRFEKLVAQGMTEKCAAIACNTAGSFRYSRSEFVRLYEEGGVFLLDEVDAGDGNALLTLNSALAGKTLSVPNRVENPTAIRHEDFICIAAANTFGTGADRQYVGRNQLDEAFLDRFRAGQVTMDYDKGLEAYICPDELLRERIQAYRANCGLGMIRRVISSRFMKDAYISLLCGLTDEEIDEALFGGWRPDELEKVKKGVVIKPRHTKDKYSDPVVRAIEHNGHEKTNGDGVMPGSPPYDEEIPIPPTCPVAGHGPMRRMSSNKGWRCACPGNKWDDIRRKWSLCNEAVFDKVLAKKE